MNPVAALELRSVDLQIPKNKKEHHTQEMSSGELILRRGQSFRIKLIFNRPFRSQTDQLTFETQAGPESTELLGTQAKFLLTQTQPGNVWSAFNFIIDANSLEVSLFTPANAIIGHYKLKAGISQGQGPSVTYPLGSFILLFNPWSTEDDVYLPSESLLREYIMSDYGFVYKGYENSITSRPWNYGQFEEDIMDICFEILNKSLYFLKNPSKDYSQRGNVVYVSRVVSAMINSNDDSGVLQGNWGEGYSQGVSPLEWNGSVAILRQWSARGGQPVKYGQCWVFCLCYVHCNEMLRCSNPGCLQFPFCTQHRRNLTIDTYYDRTAEMLPTQKPDKIWNFHVWNECWMIRKDLPPGYNGWQVLDPTPQQNSSGLFCCGPTSVKAIKEGDVHLPYDTPFVYAEVNADEVIWLFEDGQAQEILAHNTNSIGKEISTKMVGSDERLDITSSYKYPEGSPEERSIFMKASRKMLEPRRASSSLLDLLGSEGFKDQPVQLQLHLTCTPTWGQDLLLMLHVQRVPDRAHAQDSIRMIVRFCAQALLHGGSTRKPLWRHVVYLNLDFGKEIQCPLLLPYSNYRNKLTDEKLIRVSGIAEVEETRQSILVLKDFSLEPPVYLWSLGTLMAGQTIRIQLELFPIKAGPHQLQVLISSDEVKEIKSYKDIFVAATAS